MSARPLSWFSSNTLFMYLSITHGFVFIFRAIYWCLLNVFRLFLQHHSPFTLYCLHYPKAVHLLLFTLVIGWFLFCSSSSFNLLACTLVFSDGKNAIFPFVSFCYVFFSIQKWYPSFVWLVWLFCLLLILFVHHLIYYYLLCCCCCSCCWVLYVFVLFCFAYHRCYHLHVFVAVLSCFSSILLIICV